MKKETSKWIKKRDRTFRDFHWQNGYGVFSVSQSLVKAVIAYIENQAKHHRKMTFQEEFRAICAKHNVAIDERYVWT